MEDILIRNANIVNEGEIREGDVLIQNGYIARIGGALPVPQRVRLIDADGHYLFPGLIDDQVHFREPGLTHKADIYSESRAAVAGGITSFMEMPNTSPPATTQSLLAEKYAIAARDSLANYSFYMGVSNTNLEEVLKTDPKNVCGIKVFMGSSTGNMLVDDADTLEALFAKAPTIIAAHCEDEATIRANTERYKKEYGEAVPMDCHPLIRSEEACYKSSSMACSLARQHGTRLHVLHISTAKELALFDNTIPLAEKKITAEACLHHLWFDQSAYAEKGSLVKWNPAIKTGEDRAAIFEAVLQDKIDVIATDHAPHTLEEKQNTYFKAPSGGPLVQHSLPVMMAFYRQGRISLPKIAEKLCHNPAILFQIEKRGFIREGYFADLVIVDPDSPWTVSRENVLAKCGWSPFEGATFPSKVTHTIVSGRLAYRQGVFKEGGRGMRLSFLR